MENNIEEIKKENVLLREILSKLIDDIKLLQLKYDYIFKKLEIESGKED